MQSLWPEITLCLARERQAHLQAQHPTKHAASSWGLDGWFMSDGKNIIGPLSTRSVIDLPEALQPYHLISRSGFSQWYNHQDLVQCYRSLSEDLPWHTPSDSHAAEEASRAHSANYQDENRVKARGELYTAAAHIGPTSVSTTVIIDLQPDAGPTPASHATPQSAVPAILAASSPKLEPEESTTPPPSLPRCHEENYLHFKGALRLGRKRYVLGVFMQTLCSLGISCFIFAEKMRSEIAWHLKGSPHAPNRRDHDLHRSDTKKRAHQILEMILCALPVLCVLRYLPLSHGVQLLERQNGYLHTHTSMTLLCCLFPPLALSYLQAGLNHHWHLHLKYISDQTPPSHGTDKESHDPKSEPPPINGGEEPLLG